MRENLPHSLSCATTVPSVNGSSSSNLSRQSWTQALELQTIKVAFKS